MYRTRSGDAWDRIIDFGSGNPQDNVVVAFGPSMAYSVYQGSSLNGQLRVNSPAGFPVDEWTHVAVVQSRSSESDTMGPAKIYWDGVERASGTLNFPLSVARTGLYVGKSHSPDDPMFTGQMSRSRIWPVNIGSTDQCDLPTYKWERSSGSGKVRVSLALSTPSQ